MRIKYGVALTAAIAALIGSATGADPASTKIVPANFQKQQKQAAPPALGVYKLSPGKVLPLKVDGVTAATLTWNVIQPVGTTGTRIEVVRHTAVPKKAPIFAQLEGDPDYSLHTFDVETLCLTSTGKGSGYVIVQALVAEPTGVKVLAEMTVDVLGPRPPPPTPTPTPVPVPVPVPPTPTPTPPAPPIPVPDQDVPIGGAGFRVFVLIESDALSKLKPARLNALYADAVRKYLSEKCVKGPDGVTPEWRIWDQDLSTVNESKIWQDAMKRAKEKAAVWRPKTDVTGKVTGPTEPLPFVLISNGKTGYEGVLPDDDNTFLELLKKYGG